jgi:hypothetical protein
MHEGQGGKWVRSIPYGTSEDKSIVLDRANPDNFRAWPLDVCRPLSDWPADAAMSCTRLKGNRVPDDVVPNHLRLNVVSERARTVFQRLDPEGQLVQFLPVRLDYRGKDLGEYYVMNLLKSLSALNREQSNLVLFTSLDVSPQPVGTIKAIKRGVLNTADLEYAPHLFRLAEYPTWVLFSPVLQAELAAAGIAGFEFLPVSVA